MTLLHSLQKPPASVSSLCLIRQISASSRSNVSSYDSNFAFTILMRRGSSISSIGKCTKSIFITSTSGRRELFDYARSWEKVRKIFIENLKREANQLTNRTRKRTILKKASELLEKHGFTKMLMGSDVYQ